MEFIEAQGPFGDYECCSEKKHDPIVVVPFSILWLFNIALEPGPLIDDLYIDL